MKTVLIAFALLAGSAVFASAVALADTPRTSVRTLVAFCSGDQSYGPHAWPGCLHYANGVIDALQIDLCPPFDSSSGQLRDAIAAWLRDQDLKGIDLDAMSGADAVRSTLAAYCKRE